MSAFTDVELRYHAGHADIIRVQLDGKTGTGYQP
jgi:hypothetical protein